jgi:hypothetical protein
LALVTRHFVEKRLTDTHLADTHLADTHLAVTHLADTHLADTLKKTYRPVDQIADLGVDQTLFRSKSVGKMSVGQMACDQGTRSRFYLSTCNDLLFRMVISKRGKAQENSVLVNHLQT